MTRINDDILQILRHVECDGPNVRLTGQLDRQTYVRVNKVLEALGGKWNRKAKTHVFDGESSELIADAVSTGEYLDAKKAYQFFETPDSFADELVAKLSLCCGTRVLEPSAGRGALIRAIGRSGGYSFMAMVTAVELNGSHHAVLSELQAKVHITDFLTLTPENIEGPFEAVLMNPPFTRSQDIAHVMHAYGFLAHGGRLVSVMSPGFTFRTDRKATEFREWLSSVGGMYKENPPGTFKASGTSVNTVTVVIDK